MHWKIIAKEYDHLKEEYEGTISEDRLKREVADSLNIRYQDVVEAITIRNSEAVKSLSNSMVEHSPVDKRGSA